MSMMRQKMDLDSLVDRARLAQWLDAHVPELGSGPLELAFLHGGTSNATIGVDRGGPLAILRRTPLDAPPGSARSMLREARLLGALAGTAVPHPHLYAVCEDAGVIGAPFTITAKVEGWAGQLTATGCDYPPPFDRAPHRGEVMFAMADAIAALASVDWRAAGLEDFGRPEGFLERQVGRWRSQLASYPREYPGWTARDLPWLEEVSAWLDANRPPMSLPGIVHGDIGAPNCLFGHGLPTRLAAILDWELCTIGDPLLDLGLLVYSLHDERDPLRRPVSAYFDPAGMPTRQAVARRYSERTGRDTGGLDYYMTLAQFKLACIVEYKVARAAIGLESKEVGAIFESLVPRLLEECKAIIDLQASAGALA
ncbi:phosphotransferase family protein [Novosphingobium resinovorum]|nr:phosphotransferase family protein [Novosphingobium resinovorum]